MAAAQVGEHFAMDGEATAASGSARGGDGGGSSGPRAMPAAELIPMQARAQHTASCQRCARVSNGDPALRRTVGVSMLGALCDQPARAAAGVRCAPGLQQCVGMRWPRGRSSLSATSKLEVDKLPRSSCAKHSLLPAQAGTLQALLVEACAIGWSLSRAEASVLSSPLLPGLLTPPGPQPQERQ